MVEILKMAWSMEHGAQIKLSKTFVLKFIYAKLANYRILNLCTISSNSLLHAPCKKTNHHSQPLNTFSNSKLLK